MHINTQHMNFKCSSTLRGWLKSLQFCHPVLFEWYQCICRRPLGQLMRSAESISPLLHKGWDMSSAFGEPKWNGLKRKCCFEILHAEIMSPEDASWITLWSEWHSISRDFCWRAQFFCFSSVPESSHRNWRYSLLGWGLCSDSLLFILDVLMEQVWFYFVEEKKKKTWNALLNGIRIECLPLNNYVTFK